MFRLQFLFFYPQEFQVATKRLCILLDALEVSFKNCYSFGDIILLRRNPIVFYLYPLQLLRLFRKCPTQFVNFMELQVELVATVIMRNGGGSVFVTQSFRFLVNTGLAMPYSKLDSLFTSDIFEKRRCNAL